MKEETIELVSSLQKIQINILFELDRVCKENNLQYCLAFGSCLGAIRHKGFIPWDDDIDVYMPISDFARLRELANQFANGYFFQTHETDPEYGLAIGRLRDSNTTLIEENETERDINHGIFVDIYPLYNVSESMRSFKRDILISRIYRLMLYKVAPVNRGVIMKLGATVLLRLVPGKIQNKIVNRMQNSLEKKKTSGLLSSMYGDEESIRYPKEWFFPAKEAEFDGLKVPIPRQADAYLTRAYGDYMTIPPVEEQEIHHEFVFVDFRQSYTEYKGQYYCKNRK